MGHSLCNPYNRDVIKVSWEQKKEQLTFGGIPEGIAEVMLSSSTSYQSFPGDSRAVAERSTEEIPGTRKNVQINSWRAPAAWRSIDFNGTWNEIGAGGCGVGTQCFPAFKLKFRGPLYSFICFLPHFGG